MTGRLAVFAGAAALAFGCADLVGITELPEAGPVPEAGPLPDVIQTGVCNGGTEKLVTSATLDKVAAGGGEVFARIPTYGVVSCATTTVCSEPSSILGLTASQALQDFALGGSLLFYTVQGATNQNLGSVRSAGFDGTGDQAVLSGLAYPTWIAVAGSRTFWVDDASKTTSSLTPAVAHCIGCSASDAPWITGLDATHGLVADANDVYVLADDGTNQSTYGIYGCSVAAACGGSPRVVALGLDTSAQTFASDGTNVYVARADFQDVVRIDPAGKATPLAANISVAALAVDASTAELFFFAGDGAVSVVKTDGSSSASLLSTCDTSYGSPAAIAFDGTSVYVLMDLVNGGDAVFSVPRP